MFVLLFSISFSRLNSVDDRLREPFRSGLKAPSTRLIRVRERGLCYYCKHVCAPFHRWTTLGDVGSSGSRLRVASRWLTVHRQPIRHPRSAVRPPPAGWPTAVLPEPVEPLSRPHRSSQSKHHNQSNHSGRSYRPNRLGPASHPEPVRPAPSGVVPPHDGNPAPASRLHHPSRPDQSRTYRLPPVRAHRDHLTEFPTHTSRRRS